VFKHDLANLTMDDWEMTVSYVDYAPGRVGAARNKFLLWRRVLPASYVHDAYSRAHTDRFRGGGGARHEPRKVRLVRPASSYS
jgi:hypothetical protein